MVLMIGRRMALTMPKITATARSVPAFSAVLPPSLMPSITTVAIPSDTAPMMSRMRMPMAVIVARPRQAGGAGAGGSPAPSHQRADQLLLDRCHRDHRPPQRAALGHHREHVRPDPRQPVGGGSQAERRTDRRRAFRRDRVQQ